MNIRKFNIYGLAMMSVLATGLTSCSDDPAPAGDDALVIKAQLRNSAGQAENAGWTEGSRVAVLAGGTTYTYTLAADGSLAPSGNALAWNGTDIDVKAWTPVVDQAVSIADQTTAEKLSACDFLYAEAKASSRYMYLIFDHQMTRMTWDLRHVDSSYSQEDVNNAKVYFLGYGMVNFRNGEVAASGNPDTQISTLESVSDGIRSGEAIMAPADMWGKPLVKIVIGGDEYLYTPEHSNASDEASAAGSLVAGKWQKYHLSITRKTLTVQMETSDVAWSGSHIFGNGDITDAKLTATIAADVTGKPGYTVRGLDKGYITDRATGFSISYTENAFGGLTWTGNCKVTRTETLVSGNTTVQTYTFTDVKSDIEVSYLTGVEEGDYLYDNGAWGKDEAREGCRTVGRVFHVGRDSRDNSVYDLCKIRGYVVPLSTTNTSEMQWFANQAETKYINALAGVPVLADPAARESYCGGYLLTGLLETALAPFSADWEQQVPFWYAFKHLGMAAPSLSSGWYIPTYAQLKDVCASKMYDKFQGVYWSSQVYPGTGNAAVGGVEEGDKTTLWAIRCGADQAVGYGWAIDRAKLLTILTF